jgi:hypothetical protein
MQLPNAINPIIYTPPSIGGKTFPQVTLTQLNVRWVDDTQNQVVRACIAGIPKPLILWQGTAYTAIGNWTEAQAEEQLIALLGSNPAQVIKGLF